MGSNFIKRIRTIYHTPKAAVITNGMTSDFFPLMRRTRQGCPLSSSLFAAVIEILATCVWDNTNIEGVYIDKDEHKISLYADDIVLYIKNPENSLPYLYNTIEQFGKYSGYKINYNKSNACLLHMNLTEKIWKSYPFQWSPEGFKYLGIQFTMQLNDLFKNNYIPLTNELNADLDRWAKLHLSLLGRINGLRTFFQGQIFFSKPCLVIYPQPFLIFWTITFQNVSGPIKKQGLSYWLLWNLKQWAG